METNKLDLNKALSKKTALKASTTQYCGFKIMNDLLAVSVLDVQEIIKPQKLTIVPLSTPHIRGLVNLRGQIVTTISLRKFFGLEDYSNGDYMNVIVRSGESLTALMVDEICDVIDAETDTFEKTPDTLKDNLRPYVKGVHKLTDSLLVVLNLEKLLT